MKVKILALLILLTPIPVFASVRVSEIMYDVSGADTGREWIEVVNQGSMPVDLSAYKVFEGGISHKIIAIKGDALLAPGAVAIIADNPTKFLIDWPNTPGAIFDSTFSLSNSGETIAITAKDLTVDDSIMFTAKDASGNGLSLSRGDDGQLVGAKPTPGVYVAAPTRVVIAPAAPTVTPKAKGGLQTPAPTPAATEDQAVAPTNSAADDPSEPAADTQRDTTSSVWLWALGALGLSLLGAGSIYALKMQNGIAQTDTREMTHRALQKEAATYEIIE